MTDSVGWPPLPSPAEIESIRQHVLDFFDAHQREMPWRATRDAYSIWISEIMLQQTRVAAVIPFYERWLARFPTVRDLANAELDEVLSLWSGLGYYSRARNIHRGAKELVENYGGELPRTAVELRKLPGIGRYTAGAIASQAYEQAAALVDGNVARLFARLFAIDEDIKKSSAQKKLWQLAESLVPSRRPGEFNQGLMELGATVCVPKNPRCEICPLAQMCLAREQGRESELPVTTKRKKAAEKPLIDNCALWFWQSGKVLLARRKPRGLFGGLWELPQAPEVSSVGHAIGCDLELDNDELLMVHEQELSHRRLHIRVFGARMVSPRELPSDSPYDQIAWQTLTSAAKCGLSSATQRILEKAKEDETWTSATKQSISSKKATTRS